MNLFKTNPVTHQMYLRLNELRQEGAMEQGEWESSHRAIMSEWTAQDLPQYELNVSDVLKAKG